MAKLTRVTGKVFGSAATATVGGIGQFGSAATGTPNPTTDVATIQALQAYLDGWGSAVVTSRNFPPLEEVTGVLKTISYQACYVLQEGIAEYDVNTEYSNTSIVKSVNNGIITLYASLTNSNTGHSLTDTDYWKPVVLDLNTKADVDLTNVNNSGISLALSWSLPDYSNGITVSANTDYSAPSIGWAYMRGLNAGGNFYINGVDMFFCNLNATGNDSNDTMFMVNKNDVLRFTAGTLIFYPAKGV